MFKKISGTKDILPEESSFWQEIEEISRNLFSVYNYREIRTPVIEDVDLFSRSLGEATEIVQKQMFLIRAKDEVYALRPEGTAGIVRAFIENNLDKTGGFAKLYYIGPMFRLERPQKGRLRQFHHIGCEVIGSTGPDIDIELITLADRLLKAYSISGYNIKINSLGCSEDKQTLADTLRSGLRAKINDLCEECRRRFDRNILRILDCKDESCKNVVAGLGIKNNYLCVECKEHFFRLRNGLDYLGIEYEVLPYLVRGLDYYTRTVFEIKHSSLGAQDALGAGGRYDNLIKELGGASLGAIGFAFGMERLLLAAGLKPAGRSREPVYLITLGTESRLRGLRLLEDLRSAGITCDTDYENKSLKGALRRANDLAVKAVLIIGEDELKKQAVILKDMVSGQQREIKIEEIVNELKK